MEISRRKISLTCNEVGRGTIVTLGVPRRSSGLRMTRSTRRIGSQVGPTGLVLSSVGAQVLLATRHKSPTHPPLRNALACSSHNNIVTKNLSSFFSNDRKTPRSKEHDGRKRYQQSSVTAQSFWELEKYAIPKINFRKRLDDSTYKQY